MKPEYGPLEEEIHFGNHYFEVPTFIFFLGGIYLQGKLLVKIPASSALTLSCLTAWPFLKAKKTVMQTPQRTSSNYPRILESYEKKGKNKKVTEKNTLENLQSTATNKEKQPKKNRPSSDSVVLTSALASGSLHGGHGPLHATAVQELRKPPAKETMIQWSNANTWFIPYKHTSSTSLLQLHKYMYIYIYCI